MELWRTTLARKFVRALKENWIKSNPDVGVIFGYLKEQYGELPRPDHLAIRSISGIGFGPDEAFRLFAALGYRYGGSWWIPDLHIAACHFDPPEADLEKIFFSVILIDEFEREIKTKTEFEKFRKIVRASVRPMDQFELERIIDGLGHYPVLRKNQKLWVFEKLIKFFSPPYFGEAMGPLEEHFAWLTKRNYLKERQEIIHVVAHGFIPNHFTLLLRDPLYKFRGYESMEKFAEEIRALKIPMKENIEGGEESLLCQTSTKARAAKFNIYDKQTTKMRRIEWPASYIEFVRRGKCPSSPTGRYEGFLPNQARAIFKMTAQTLT